MQVSERAKKIAKAICALLTTLAATIAVIFGLQSCEVVRDVTTSSQYVQRGDTSVIIQTKTIESYTGKKHF